MLRFIAAGGFAAVVTASLILLMHVLIQSDMKGPGEVTTYKVPSIIMPLAEIQTEYDTSKPEAPPEVQDQPPELPEIEFDAPELTKDKISIRPGSGAKVKIAGPGGLGGDGEYLPIVKVQPEYPRRATQRGKEGYCTVQYTVTSLGTTKDVVIADCPDSIFARASIKAAGKFKYKPRVIDGEAIEVQGIQNRFTFELAKEE